MEPYKPQHKPAVELSFKLCVTARMDTASTPGLTVDVLNAVLAQLIPDAIMRDNIDLILDVTCAPLETRNIIKI